MIKSFLYVVLVTTLTVETLFPGMEVNELSKLPALLEHFHQHQKTTPGISFIAFLELHYGNPAHHEQDHQTHHKLPFSDHHSAGFQAHHLLFTMPDCTTSFNIACQTIKKSFLYKSPAEHAIYSSIWQPPRLS